jgi:hypothetical protein
MFVTSLGLAEIFIHHDPRLTSSGLPRRGSGLVSSGMPEIDLFGSNHDDLTSPTLSQLPPKEILLYIRIMRLLSVFIALYLNTLMFGQLELWSKRDDCNRFTPNPDIFGSGVRWSMYILLLFVSISLGVATFHRQQSGTKELGCSVLISKYPSIPECILSELMLYRSLCDEPEFTQGQAGHFHTPTDYLVVVLMIDTQCVALSAVLSSKDALASRFYVGITLLGQAFAWAVVVYANHALASSFSPAENGCIGTYWLLSSLGGAGPLISFKIYWYLHALDFVHASWVALRHTFQFDELEKIDREERRGHTGNSTDLGTGFASLRGTPFSNWNGFAFHPLLLIVTLESHMKGVKTAAWGDWGQMMPLTMLVLGVGHWFYLNLTQCWAYNKDSTPSLGGKRMILLDSSRLIVMGFTPSETGELVHRLLTAKRSNP